MDVYTFYHKIFRIFVRSKWCKNMLTFLFGVGVVGLFFVFLSLRMWIKKEKNFRGTCASQSPFLREKETTCGYCGKPVEESMDCDKERSPLT